RDTGVHVGSKVPGLSESVAVKNLSQLNWYIGRSPVSATCDTPGIAAMRDASSGMRAGIDGSVDRDGSSHRTVAVMSRAASNPMSIRCTLDKLRMKRPAPQSSNTERAACETTSAERRREDRTPMPPPALSACVTSVDAD